MGSSATLNACSVVNFEGIGTHNGHRLPITIKVPINRPSDALMIRSSHFEVYMSRSEHHLNNCHDGLITLIKGVASLLIYVLMITGRNTRSVSEIPPSHVTP